MSAEKQSAEKAVSEKKVRMSRRSFVKSVTAGAGMAVGSGAVRPLFGLSTRANTDELNIAIIGVGAQGSVLTEAIVGTLGLPGIRFRAICDIWSYHADKMQATLKKNGHFVNVYEDYRELLAAEKDNLDAVIVATPDWMHAEHANACMEAGLDVYCEKEMSNSLESARTMVETARRTGKLLQIGHQRRSNPRYIHAVENLVHEMNVFGRITHAYAQWNRAKAGPIINKPEFDMPQETLEKYGYRTMLEFRNWRWSKKFGGGPIVDLGSHQIDIFSWIWKTNPSSVMAAGGTDFYTLDNLKRLSAGADDNLTVQWKVDWYDNVLCIFDYKTPQGTNRAFYQVLTTSSYGGFGEKFMGEDGTLLIGEVPAVGNSAVPEKHAVSDNAAFADIKAKWEECERRGWLRPKPLQIKQTSTKDVALDVRVTKGEAGWPLPVELGRAAHQPHLENFFNAVRDHNVKLNCPAEIGYETAVAVLRVNEAVSARTTLEFKPEDFEA